MTGSNQGRAPFVRSWARMAFGMSMVLALALPFAAGAQTTVKPEDEYKKLIKVNEDIQPLGDTPFGEKISLYDGSLSFAQTDVSLTGTGPALSLGRSFTFHGVEDRTDLQALAFGDWDMDLPQIFTVTAQQNNVPGWRVAATNHGTIGQVARTGLESRFLRMTSSQQKSFIFRKTLLFPTT